MLGNFPICLFLVDRQADNRGRERSSCVSNTKLMVIINLSMERKTTALYKTIYASLKEDIVKGRLKAGSLLPTEAELCKLYSASRSTVRKALAMLSEDNLIEARQGRGTVILGRETVADDFGYLSLKRNTAVTTRLSKESGDETSAQKAAVDIVQAGPEVAKALGLKPESQVYRLQRLKFAGGKVAAYVTSYLNPELVPGLESYDGKIADLYQFLFSEYELKIERVQDVITAELPDFVTSEIMRLPAKSPVLVARRTAWSCSILFEYTVTRSSGNMLEYVISNNILEPYPFKR